jgi:hypothetical protein
MRIKFKKPKKHRRRLVRFSSASNIEVKFTTKERRQHPKDPTRPSSYSSNSWYNQNELKSFRTNAIRSLIVHKLLFEKHNSSGNNNENDTTTATHYSKAAVPRGCEVFCETRAIYRKNAMRSVLEAHRQLRKYFCSSNEEGIITSAGGGIYRRNSRTNVLINPEEFISAISRRNSVVNNRLAIAQGNLDVISARNIKYN